MHKGGPPGQTPSLVRTDMQLRVQWSGPLYPGWSKTSSDEGVGRGKDGLSNTGSHTSRTH